MLNNIFIGALFRSNLIKNSGRAVMCNGKHIKGFSFETCRFHPRRSHGHSRCCETFYVWLIRLIAKTSNHNLANRMQKVFRQYVF